VWNNWYPVGWAFFFITGLNTKIGKKLVKLGFSDREVKDILAASSCADRLTPLVEAEIGTLELARAIKLKATNIDHLAKQLTNKFGWMSVYNTEDQVRGPEYYISEAEKLNKLNIDTEEKNNVILPELAKNQKLFDSHMEKISDDLLKEQLLFWHASGYLRDKREEARDRITILEKPVYEAIAEKLNITLHEAVYLSNDEILAALADKLDARYLQTTALARAKRYVFTVTKQQMEIIDDQKQIDQIAKMFEVSSSAEIKGQVACKSNEIVRGPVKVVFNNKEIGKIEDGDILVTTMTKPDFLSAMKKAKAFVTDEGGLTCHAAIIARELKKPCIIGTKIATQVLKDGDLVEIDTNNGIVKILEKSK
ncbi:MAG: PEP-utilizing enzyme, partial [Candidatus Paceibacterota bacterium]